MDCDYGTLNSLRRAFLRENGKAATDALLMKHGGKAEGGEVLLASVPEESWSALAAEFGHTAESATAKVRPKTLGQLYAPAFQKFNAAKGSRHNE